jgi:hypothetical protein
MKRSSALAMLSLIAGLLVISGPALGQQKTVKACQDEWRANRAANQSAGITEKDYVAKCRAGAAAAPAPAPARPTATTPAAPSPTTGSAPAPKRTATEPAAPLAGNQFSSEAQAKAHCTRDIVVWANLDSRIYHFSGNKQYGNTKEGAYMCEKEALGQGIRAAKNEKHP